MPDNSLTDLLMREQSRANTDMIVGIMLEKPELFEELWKLMCQKIEPISRRAAWAADHCTEKYPTLLNGKIEDLANIIPTFESDGLKRHGLNMMMRSELPDENLGLITNTCFEWLRSNKESIAIKALCMKILYRVTQQYPELARELYNLIEIQLDEGSPGIINCGQKIMKKLGVYL